MARSPTCPRCSNMRPASPPCSPRRVAAAFADEHALARRDAANVAHLAERLGPDVPLLRVPLLDGDVHDVEGLVRLRRELFRPATDRWAQPARAAGGCDQADSPTRPFAPAAWRGMLGA